MFCLDKHVCLSKKFPNKEDSHLSSCFTFTYTNLPDESHCQPDTRHIVFKKYITVLNFDENILDSLPNHPKIYIVVFLYIF